MGRREPGGTGTRTESRFRVVRGQFRHDSLLRERRPEGIPLLVSAFQAANIIGGGTADVSNLPWSDGQQLHLDPAVGVSGVMGGVGGAGAATIGFPAWVWLDGQEHPCQLQADFAGQERILGRDVLNRMDVLFRGPGGEVVLNP